MSEKKLEDQQKIIDLQDEIIDKLEGLDTLFDLRYYKQALKIEHELVVLRDKLKGLRE